MNGNPPTASGAEPTRVQVLGPLQVMRDGQEVDLRGPRPRLLLAILISRADQSVALDRLIDDLYGEDPPPTARKSAQVHISNLRRAFGEGGPLTTLPGGYSFDTSGVEVDAIEFEREVEAATALAVRDPEQASVRLAAALARWHGSPYSDVGTEQALQAEITRLSELRLRAIELRIEADLRLGRHAELLGELETLTTDHPYREQLRGFQMLALYRSGRQADALRVFAKTRALLVDELGIEPSSELSELESRILDQSPELALEELPDRDRFAFLVTDIEDSTVMWEHDPDRMGAALARHDEILDEEIETRQGRVFKHTGDGVLAVFPAIGPAVDAGIAIQTRLRAESWPTNRPIRVRAAVDEGTVERRGDDYFGPVMNRVARVMSAAHAGQLLVSESAAAATDARSRSLGNFDLTGVGRVGIHQIIHGDLDEEFPDLRTDGKPMSFARPGFEQAIRGYELREELGTGDFGVVYRAYQASVGREVAVKVIRPEFANRSDFVKRFEAEAQFVAQLEHPHIVSLYDYWRDPEGAYLVMNYLRGGSLAQALERGTWNPPAVLRLVDQIGTALAYAHRNGVTHRDIKPGNVLLDDDGNAYLSDFGIAARTLQLDSDDRHTSVAYLAPEQLAGAPVDARSDIYAIALLTYEMITGQRPELGGQPRSVHEVRHDLPAELDVVFDRATTAVPEQRYARVEDFLRGFRQAFGVDAAPAAPRLDVEIRNPFKGLRAFTEIDAGDFYGREAVVEQLIESVRNQSFTAAVGPSGCGKSSVIKAGLLPAVRSGALGLDVDFVIAEMFPGSYPFEELESALLRVAVDRPDGLLSDLELDERGLLRASKQVLPDDQTMMLLIIDQFEELFSLVTDDSVRNRFLDSLVTVANDDRSRVRVLATMRADFFDRPLQYPEFGEVLKRGLVPIAMPTSDNLALAISQPARSVGLELEPGLVGAVVGDVADQPGGLPLMQYALTEMVDRRESNALTLDEYHSTGGAPGALARRAEDIYSGLSPTSQSATRDLFLRLVAVSEESDDTRRRVRLSELSSMHVDQSALGETIDEYGAFRLLSFDHDPVTRGPTVEVAHEALIREWPRYRDWIDDHRDDLLLGRRLEAATRDWDEGERDPSFLLLGGRLEQYREWATETDLRITEVEREYLDASVEQGDREESRERGRVRRLRALLAGVGVVALVAVIAGLVALQSRNEEADARAEADIGRLIAQARTLSEQDPTLAMLAAVEAFDREDRAESRGALQEAVMAEPSFAGRMQVVGGGSSLTEGPDGAWFFMSRIVPGVEASEGVWYDPQTLEPMGSVTVDERWGLTSSPDRSLIAARWRIPPWDVEGDPRLTEVRIHDNTGLQLASLPTNGPPGMVRFLSDQLLVVADGAGLTIWDVRAREIVKQIEIPDATTFEVADVSPGGSLMLVSSPGPFGPREDSGAMLIDLEAGVVVPGTAVPCAAQCPVRFDPSGERVAIGEPGGVVVRDVGTWEIETTIVAPDDVMVAADFSDDGTTLYLGTAEADLAFYDVRSGERVAPTIRAGGEGVAGVMTVPGGEIITRSWLGLIQRWTVDRSGPFGTWLGSGGGFGTFAPDSSVFVRTNDPDPGWVTHYEPATGDVVESIQLVAGKPLGAITFSPDGKRVAVAELSGEVSLYDAVTFEATGDLLPGEGFMFSTFSPDGEKLAIGANFTPTTASRQTSSSTAQLGSRPFAAHIWDIESGQVTPLALTVDFEGAGRPTWKPDGTQVALSDITGGDAVFDAETGLQVGSRFSVRGEGQAREVLWEADGDHLLGVGEPGVSRWDVSTGERTVPFTELTEGQWMELADDGKLLVTASASSEAQLWDLEAGSPLGAPLPDPGLGFVGDVVPPFPALSPDGKYLAMTGANGTVLWSLDPQLWRDLACQLAGRNMTENEWANLMGDTPYRRTCDRWPAG